MASCESRIPSTIPQSMIDSWMERTHPEEPPPETVMEKTGKKWKDYSEIEKARVRAQTQVGEWAHLNAPYGALRIFLMKTIQRFALSFNGVHELPETETEEDVRKLYEMSTAVAEEGPYTIPIALDIRIPDFFWEKWQKNDCDLSEENACIAMNELIENIMKEFRQTCEKWNAPGSSHKGFMLIDRRNEMETCAGIIGYTDPKDLRDKLTLTIRGGIVTTQEVYEEYEKAQK